jgi:Ulp1 family protease
LVNRPRCYFFPTYFYHKLTRTESESACVSAGYNFSEVKKYLKALPAGSTLFDFDCAFIPIHATISHWCLAVIQFQQKCITYYDSKRECPPTDHGVLQNLLSYLLDLGSMVNRVQDASRWTTSIALQSPQQRGDNDCGVFVCKIAEYLSKGCLLPVTFTLSDINCFRSRMLLDILSSDIDHEY